MTITTLSPAAAAQKVRRWVSHDGVADVFREAYQRVRFSDFSHSFSDISFLNKQSPKLTLDAQCAFLAVLHDLTYKQFAPIILHPRRTRVLQGVREEAAYRRWRHCVETSTAEMEKILPELVFDVQKALHEQGLLPKAPAIDPPPSPTNISQTTNITLNKSQTVVVSQADTPATREDPPAAGEGEKGGKSASGSTAAEEREPAKTADEAVSRIGRDWATYAELARATGRTESGIRSRISRAGILEDDMRNIPRPSPRTARIEYRIRAVWRHIKPDTERSQKKLSPKTAAPAQ